MREQASQESNHNKLVKADLDSNLRLNKWPELSKSDGFLGEPTLRIASRVEAKRFIVSDLSEFRSKLKDTA